MISRIDPFSATPGAAPGKNATRLICAATARAPVGSSATLARPFAAVNTIAIFVIAFVPELSLWLPRLLGY